MPTVLIFWLSQLGCYMQYKRIGLFWRILISGGKGETNVLCRPGWLFLCVRTKAKHSINVKAEQKGYINPETKKSNPKPPNLTQNTQQTQFSNHKASDKRSWFVNIKWQRKRCVWAQVQFRQCKLSSPLLIRRTCHFKNHRLILSQCKSVQCHFTQSRWR